MAQIQQENSFPNQAAYNKATNSTNIPRSRENSLSDLSRMRPNTLPKPYVGPKSPNMYGSRTSINTSDGGYRSMPEPNATNSVDSAGSGRSSARHSPSKSNKMSKVDPMKQVAKIDKTNQEIAVNNTALVSQTNVIASTTNNLVVGLNETKKDLVKLEKNSRRILQGVVGRVEPFANSVNKIVMDNSRLKQEVTWLYRELDFMRDKMAQQQEMINVLLANSNMESLIKAQTSDKCELEEVEDIKDETILEKMLEEAKDFEDRKKIRASLRALNKKKDETALAKAQAKQKSDNSDTKSISSSESKIETKSHSEIHQLRSGSVASSISKQSESKIEKSHSVTASTSKRTSPDHIINNSNASVSVNRSYSNTQKQSSISRSESVSTHSPNSSSHSPTEPATIGALKVGAPRRMSKSQAVNKINNNLSQSMSTLAQKSTTSSNSTLYAQQQNIMSTSQSSSTSTTTKSTSTVQKTSTTTTSSHSTSTTQQHNKVTRNKTMPASTSAEARKKAFMAKLEANGSSKSKMKLARSAFSQSGSGMTPTSAGPYGSSQPGTPGLFSGAGSPAKGVRRGSSFVVPNATGVKALLLKWCQQRVKNYPEVEIVNFSSSWASGMAFCALIHSFFPDAYDFSSLSPLNREANFELAFSTAE